MIDEQIDQISRLNIQDLYRMNPEELYGIDTTEILNFPFPEDEKSAEVDECPWCGAPVTEEGCSNGLCEAVN